MKKRIACRIIFTLLTVLLIAFIFGNSLADGEQSADFSLLVMQWLNSMFEYMHIPLELSHMFVRKLAHFSEYSLLGILLTATVCSWRREQWRFGAVWQPIAYGAVIAAADELLQTFVPGRCGAVADSLLDFSGVLWAALAASAVIMLKIRSNKSKSVNTTKRKNKRG